MMGKYREIGVQVNMGCIDLANIFVTTMWTMLNYAEMCYPYEYTLRKAEVPTSV